MASHNIAHARTFRVVHEAIDRFALEYTTASEPDIGTSWDTWDTYPTAAEAELEMALRVNILQQARAFKPRIVSFMKV
jgi:hypothetical protein